MRFVAATTGLAVCLLGSAVVAGQGGPPPAAAPPMAENVYLDVQVLKGIPVDQFNDTMGMFSAALLLDCVGCHSPRITIDTKAFAIPTPRIQMARAMVRMMNTINQQFFGGQQRVTCFTCHSGDPSPERSPSLRLQYGELVEDPTSLKFFPSLAAPPAADTFAKYIQALGGVQRVGAIKSYQATGTYSGFETLERAVPVEIFGRAPDQRAIVAHDASGDVRWTFDGRRAWRYQPDTPVPFLDLTGWNVDGARLDAMAYFPLGLQSAYGQWQTGYADIDDKQVNVLRGTAEGRPPVNLYFDASGLLVRLTRWTNTGAGPVPIQIDYSDYRDVAGAKMPFHWVMTWTNGRAEVILKEIRPNVAIPDARFAPPAR